MMSLRTVRFNSNKKENIYGNKCHKTSLSEVVLFNHHIKTTQNFALEDNQETEE